MNTVLRKRFLTIVMMAPVFLVISCREAGVKDLVIYGDSTAVASRIPVSQKFWNLFPYYDRQRWWNRLRSKYTPPLRIANYGKKGRSIASLSASVLDNPANRSAVVIIYDRANSDESASLYMSYLNLAVSRLRTTHFLIMPQVPDSIGHGDGAERDKMNQINILVQQEWRRNTFSGSFYDAFLRNLSPSTTRVDGIHRNGIGQEIEFRFISAWLKHRKWIIR